MGTHLKDRMRASCYMLFIVGNDNSGMSIVNYKLWLLTKNLRQCKKMACGAATLAYLCRNLELTSRAYSKELAGCWLLLEVLSKSLNILLY